MESTKNIAEFERVYRETRTVQKARLAAGWSEGQSRKGKHGLNRDFLAVMERVDQERGTRAVMVIPPVREPVERVLPPALEANQFQPGESGNPAGGSKLASFRAGLKRKLQNHGIEPIIDKVYMVASGKTKHDSDALHAAEIVRDTMEGKPTQKVDMRGIVVMMPAESDLAALDAWAGDE